MDNQHLIEELVALVDVIDENVKQKEKLLKKYITWAYKISLTKEKRKKLRSLLCKKCNKKTLYKTINKKTHRLLCCNRLIELQESLNE